MLKSTIHSPSLDNQDCQDRFLSDFKRSISQGDLEIKLMKLNLALEDLHILLIVSEYDGIGAKQLGQKIHLSRYAALNRANQLVGAGLLVCERIQSTKTGIKPAYSFHIAPGLTKEAILQVLEQKKTKPIQSSQVVPIPVANLEPAEPEPGILPRTFKQSPDLVDMSALKLNLLNLPSVALEILKIITSQGITTTQVAQEFDFTLGQSHKYLKLLFDQKWLIRKSLPSKKTVGTGGHIYFLAHHLTPELIESALEPSLKSSIQQRKQEDLDSIIDPSSDFSQYQSESTMNSEFNNTASSNIKLIKLIREIITLRRQVATLADLEQELKLLGGEEAEKLLEDLDSGNL